MQGIGKEGRKKRKKAAGPGPRADADDPPRHVRVDVRGGGKQAVCESRARREKEGGRYTVKLPGKKRGKTSQIGTSGWSEGDFGKVGVPIRWP